MIKRKVKASTRQTVAKDMPFMSVSHLLTAILTELKTEYVTEQTPKDKKMRSRIKLTIDLINSYSEISNLVIKGNPFKKIKHQNSSNATGSSNNVLPSANTP